MNVKISELNDKNKIHLKTEKKYLEKINKQNDRMRVIKKLFDQQAKKNIELNQINKKLNEKLVFYISNGKINQDEYEDLARVGLVDKKIAKRVEEYLDIDEHEMRQVNFFYFEKFLKLIFRLIFMILL